MSGQGWSNPDLHIGVWPASEYLEVHRKYKSKSRQSSADHLTYLIKGMACVTCGKEANSVVVWVDAAFEERVAWCIKQRKGLHVDLCHIDEVSGKHTWLTIDHIVPRAHGGSNKLYNLQPMCSPCNSAKGDKLPEVLPTPQYLDRIAICGGCGAMEDSNAELFAFRYSPDKDFDTWYCGCRGDWKSSPEAKERYERKRRQRAADRRRGRQLHDQETKTDGQAT